MPLRPWGRMMLRFPSLPLFFVGIVAFLFLGLHALSLLVPPTQAGGISPRDLSGPGGDDDSAPVDPQVLDEIETKGETLFFVELKGEADLSAAYAIAAWNERGWYVLNTLRSFAEKSQREVRKLLDQEKARGAVRGYTPYYIANVIAVTAGRDAVQLLAVHPDVKAIKADQVYAIPPPEPGDVLPQLQSVEWNISKINADDVWSEFGIRGQGIVVANIDTGVDYDHPALVSQYRGNLGGGSFNHNYNWWDPTGVCGSTPCDNNNHGTHTMGTMVGDDGGSNKIGVAPGGQWMAAKGCASNWCSSSHLISAAQWILAPWDLSGNPATADPTKRPHAVNNSWGSSGGNTWYLAYVNAWRAAGIFPAFAIGNSGPSCYTAGSPGDYPTSFGTGATDSGDNIASFSSRGPSAFGGIKPDASAPGVSVRSSVNGGGYASYSGTSMASPHTAGVVALLWSAAPSLRGNITATITTITTTATFRSSTACGSAGPPNNVYGWGRIDAYAAVDMVRNQGWLVGQVTEASSSPGPAAVGDPVSGIGVQAASALATYSTTTGATGLYTLPLPAATYTVSLVPSYGYLPRSLSGIVVSTGLTTTLHLTVATASTWQISGVVTSTQTGLPLTATVAVLNTPVPTATTDPATGAYSLTVAQGTHTLRAQSPGYEAQSRVVTVTSHRTENFALAPRQFSSYPCTDCPKNIRDYTTITSTLFVTDPLVIADLSLDVNISHTWIGDLTVDLLSPQNTRVRLHNRSGGSADNIVCNYELTCEADGPGELEDFEEQNARGFWRLIIRDHAGADEGRLNSWTLHITGTTSALYPVTGTVTELGTGTPLSATVAVLNSAVPTATTDPATGYYSLTVPQGVYRLRAQSPEHLPSTRLITVTRPLTENFQLQVGGAYPCTDCPKIIADLSAITSTITVHDAFTVTDLSLDVNISHSNIGDLIVELVSPQSLRVRLHNRSGGSRANIRGNYDLSLPVDGPGTLDDFIGQGAQGHWKLFISDNAMGHMGRLNFWTLYITGTRQTLPVTIKVEPSGRTVAVSAIFTTAIVVDAGPQLVDTVAAYLNFDPQYLNVVNESGEMTSTIIPSSDLPMVLTNRVNHASGQIDYTAGRAVNTPPISGTFTVATIRWKALQTTSSSTPITFSFAAPRTTEVFRMGNNVLAAHTNGAITITAPSLVGRVTLLGRGSAPSERWAGYELRVNVLSGATPVLTQTAQTDASGWFTVSMPSLSPGSYGVQVKNPHSLSNRRSSVAIPVTTTQDFGVLQEGDANDDDCKRAADYSILYTAFGSVPGHPRWDSRADFNGDNNVRGDDFSVLAYGFEECGPRIITTTDRLPDRLLGTANLSLQPASPVVGVGSIFTTAIRVEAGSQPLSAVDAFLDFDPSYLQIVDASGAPATTIVAGGALPVITNTVTNSAGQINYSAGTLGSPITGTFTLATLRFKALQAITATTISFVQIEPRVTNVYYQGSSVLGSLTGAAVRASVLGYRSFLPLMFRSAPGGW